MGYLPSMISTTMWQMTTPRPTFSTVRTVKATRPRAHMLWTSLTAADKLSPMLTMVKVLRPLSPMRERPNTQSTNLHTNLPHTIQSLHHTTLNHTTNLHHTTQNLHHTIQHHHTIK